MYAFSVESKNKGSKHLNTRKDKRKSIVDSLRTILEEEKVLKSRIYLIIAFALPHEQKIMQYLCEVIFLFMYPS